MAFTIADITAGRQTQRLTAGRCCDGKRKFATRRAAEITLIDQVTRGRARVIDDTELNVYICPFSTEDGDGRHYHIGHRRSDEPRAALTAEAAL